MTLPTPKHLWRAGAVTGVASGGTVTTLPDEGGSPVTMSQADFSKRPVYTSNVLNGQPVLTFPDTLDRFFTGAGLALPAPFTVTAVVRSAIVPTGAQNILSLSPAASPFTNLAAKSNGWQFFNGGSGDAVDGSVVANQWEVVTVQFSAASTFHRNGTLTSITNPAQSANVPAGTTWYFGSGIGQFHRGDIAEIAIFSGTLPDADRADWHSRIQDTYGLTVSDYVAPVATLTGPHVRIAGAYVQQADPLVRVGGTYV